MSNQSILGRKRLSYQFGSMGVNIKDGPYLGKGLIHPNTRGARAMNCRFCLHPQIVSSLTCRIISFWECGLFIARNFTSSTLY